MAGQTPDTVRERTSGHPVRSIPSLDGLRGIAVLLVISAHLALWSGGNLFLRKHHLPWIATLTQIDAGDLGVSIFFVISGFLITTLLIRQEDGDGRVSLQGFYLRRFFRIFPPYYAYLLVVAVLWSMHRVPMVAGAFETAALYVSNYYPFRLGLPSSQGWLVGHTWSLSLEEQFYLFWPVCLHWLGRRRSAWLGAALLLLEPVSRLVTAHFLPEYVVTGQMDRLFHTRLDTIMAGCVLALLGTWPAVYRAVERAVAAWWSGLIAGGLLFLTVHASLSNTAWREVAGIGLEAVLLAYLIRYAIQHAGSVGGRALNHPWLRHIGVISYSVYLWQQMFVGSVDVTGGHRVLGFGLILVAAEVSYWTVERGSYRVRDWLLGRTVTARANADSLRE